MSIGAGMADTPHRILTAYYTLQTAHGPQPLMTVDLLGGVAAYLLHWDGQYWWDIICTGGVAGYSIYVHECTERRWYEEHGFDPLNAEHQREQYDDAHGESLIYEHRLLQSIASGKGFTFSLKELMLHNPHGTPPEYDWRIIERKHLHRLTEEDKAYDPGKKCKVDAFYTELGFQ
jgi:hypothetical protein